MTKNFETFLDFYLRIDNVYNINVADNTWLTSFYGTEIDSNVNKDVNVIDITQSVAIDLVYG